MQQICHYRHGRKTGGLFLLYDTGVNFISRNNLNNLGSFAKVSVPVKSIIPCCNQGIIVSTIIQLIASRSSNNKVVIKIKIITPCNKISAQEVIEPLCRRLQMQSIINKSIYK